MKLSLKIRLLRHRTGLDQQQVAEKLRISVGDYSKIETGALKADDAVFQSMVTLFNLDKEHFSSWPDEKAKNLIEAYLT